MIAILLGEVTGLAVAKQVGAGEGSERCRRIEADGGKARVGGLTVVLGKSGGRGVTVRADPGFRGTIDFERGAGGSSATTTLRVDSRGHAAGAPDQAGSCTVLARAGVGAGGSNGQLPKRPGMLPYTGPQEPLVALVGALLAIAGLLLRRRLRGSS